MLLSIILIFAYSSCLMGTQERKDELEKQIQQLREQTKESEQDFALLEEKDRSVRFLEKENLQLMMDLKLVNHDLMRVRT